MKHESRLAKIETKLPPDPCVVAEAQARAFAEWLWQYPMEDQIMYLSCAAVFSELGTDQIILECKPHESPLMGICRLCEWDYRRLIGMLEDWNRRGGQ
jgi:hypothetical protein